MLLISLPADSTTPCLIQIYDFLYNPDSLLSYSIAVEARGSTSSNAPTIEDDLSLYWRIQLGCGSPDNKMSVLPPPAGFRHVVIAPADPPHPAHGPRQHRQTAAGPRTSSPPAAAILPGAASFRLPGAKWGVFAPGRRLPGTEWGAGVPGRQNPRAPGTKQASSVPGSPSAREPQGMRAYVGKGRGYPSRLLDV